MNMQHWWNGTDRRMPKYSEPNLFQCHFVYHDLESKLGLLCNVPETASATMRYIVLSIPCNKYLKSELVPHREHPV
jgi:hypothetical protein